MQLAPKMEIAGNGKKFQTIVGDPVPEWVGETEVKPVGKFDFVDIDSCLTKTNMSGSKQLSLFK